ncbi:GntR family transcriptional regulator [Tomitella fengzijianii]|uniref:GntR family transcriptional regulator n=1 Tax=Tomitella fengzijianii TaxID=2597660 RepID=A0A516X261_9ACTN|nr:GntR family transcriptional regulator [Tomitella fengzijianii]QDQ97110.1 GntR family transcriptional regulator [Tomitella fengzijianii]
MTFPQHAAAALSKPPAQSAADRAYQHTKDAIIRGDLPGGTALSEVTVCTELGLSRTPVHEAFLRLAAEDLLTLASRKGALVRPMPPSEAADVLEMREAVEASAARRAIADGRAAEAAPALEEALRRQEQALAAELSHSAGLPDAAAIARFIAADDDFHTAVVAASHNPIALHFAGLLRDRQQRLRHQLLRVHPDQLRPALDQHRRLASALAAGDAEVYAAVLSEHIAMHQGIL